MTNFLLLIGAGLFSRGILAFQENAFNDLLGADVDDSGGDGPGSFNVVGNIWHLDCCNPENNFDNSGWSIFNAIFGWTNSATLGSILSYVFYWITVMVTLVIMKYREVISAINVMFSVFTNHCVQGRTKIFGRESSAGRARRIRRENAAIANSSEVKDSKSSDSGVPPILPK